MLDVRVGEFLARAEHPDRWETMRIETCAITSSRLLPRSEKNSKGRYHIICNLARQEPADYYVRFDFDSGRRQNRVYASVFQDMMRDLIANARSTCPAAIFDIRGNVAACGAVLRALAMRSRIMSWNTGGIYTVLPSTESKSNRT